MIEATGPETAGLPPDERSVVRQEERTASRVIDGQAVVIVIDAQKLHTLNEVGTRIWELADGRTVGEIADTVVEEFEVTREPAVADVLAFVTELEGLGALIVERSQR